MLRLSPYLNIPLPVFTAMLFMAGGMWFATVAVFERWKEERDLWMLSTLVFVLFAAMAIVAVSALIRDFLTGRHPWAIAHIVVTVAYFGPLLVFLWSVSVWNKRLTDSGDAS